MAKMTKTQLIDAIAEGTQVSKGDVKAVIEQMGCRRSPVGAPCIEWTSP
jgi:hypothetical protein